MTVNEAAGTLEVQGLPTAPVVYSLAAGNNLISYPYAYSNELDNALPDGLSLQAIYGEGIAAINIDGSWEGALNGFEGGSGYWFVSSDASQFEYNEPSLGGARLAAQPIAPEEYHYNQSINQFFYFAESATINDVELSNGDWIVAYNNDVVVGSRMYTANGMIDIPIMGYDESSELSSMITAGYCMPGDVPTIKVHRTNGEVVEMDAELVSGSLAFQGIGHAIVTLTDHSLPTEVALHNAYPNPFNPSTMIEYDIPSEMQVNLSIYDLRGRLIAELVNGIQQGSYDSYQVVWNADMQSSGVYFVRLTAGSSVETQKIMLIK